MSTESLATSTTALPAHKPGASVDIDPADGVFAARRKKKVLLSEVVEFKTSELRRRKPRMIGDDTSARITCTLDCSRRRSDLNSRGGSLMPLYLWLGSWVGRAGPSQIPSCHCEPRSQRTEPEPSVP